MRNKSWTRTTRTMEMRGRHHPERISTDPKRMQSETTISPMGTRMLIGMPYRAVAVLRRKNGGAAEEMGTRTKSCLRRRGRRRR